MDDWDQLFSDVLWLSERCILRADRTTIPLGEIETVLIGALVLARGNWRSVRALKRVVPNDEHEAFIGAVFNHMHDIIAKCRRTTFEIVEDPDITANGLGWKLTGHIRVVT